MKIHSLMIPNPITITKHTTISEAIELMKINSIRHLPVVSKNNNLKGFVTLADLKQGIIPSMLGDLSLTDLMIKDPITLGPDDDIETAAQLIYEHKIGGLPVVQNKKVVGILTETDIFRAFIDMMGLLTKSSRIDVVIPDEPDAVGKAIHVIHDNGGDVMTVGMTAQKAEKRIYYFRLFPCKTESIKRALEKAGFKVTLTTD